MKHNFYPVLFFISLAGQIFSQTCDTSVVRIVFTGDILGHMPVLNASYDITGDRYNFDACYQYLKPFISHADIAIANLEVPLAGKPYSGYPQFSSPDDLATGLKNAGFDVLVT